MNRATMETIDRIPCDGDSDNTRAVANQTRRRIELLGCEAG